VGLAAARRWRWTALLAAAALAVGGALALDLGGVLTRAEDATVDARFRLRGAEPPRDMLVVGIDDRTFSVLGEPWPFPRSMHGEVIRRLDRAGARAIVVDIQFTEPTVPREDLALYDAVRDAGGVVLATTEVDERGGTRVLGGEANLRRAGAWAAASNLPTASGRIIRRMPEQVGGLDSLAVRVADTLGGRRPDSALFGDGGALIDFRGPPGTIPTVSYADVHRGTVPRSRIAGRTVVIGATTPTLQDVHATPTSDRLMAGPEVQANAIWTALNGIPLRDAPAGAGLMALIVLGIGGPLLSLRMRPIGVAAAWGAAGLAYAGLAVAAFERGTVLPVAAPLAACALGIVAALGASHLAESRERRRVSGINRELDRLVRERTRELVATQVEIVTRLGRAAERRDGDTGMHIDRVSRMCAALGRAVGMSEDDAERLGLAAALHDVGKIGIPDAVLLKPGRFDEAELEVMRRHTTIGAEILAGSSSALVRLAEEIAMTHHERWDGTGYPLGLSGEQIPLPGRITAVCDVFDALLSRRPYKEAWSLEEAVDELRALAGSHFDPDLVPVFLELVPGLVGQLELRPPGEWVPEPAEASAAR
jgi:CHASE2 domain-containing sensor protein